MSEAPKIGVRTYWKTGENGEPELVQEAITRPAPDPKVAELVERWKEKLSGYIRPETNIWAETNVKLADLHLAATALERLGPTMPADLIPADRVLIEGLEAEARRQGKFYAATAKSAARMLHEAAERIKALTAARAEGSAGNGE